MSHNFDVLDAFFNAHSHAFSRHHLDGYREFIKRHIPETIKSYNPFTMVKYEDDQKTELFNVQMFIGDEAGDKLYLDRPVLHDEAGKPILLTPYEARLRDLTYATRLYADIKVKFNHVQEPHKNTVKLFPKVLLGSIPIMLHSDQCILHGQGPLVLRGLGECPYDVGGYFIVDGKEKVIVSQERMTTNRLFVEDIADKDDLFSFRGRIRCTGETGETVLQPRMIEFKLIKEDLPVFDEKDVRKSYQAYRGAVLVSLPLVKGEMPLFQAFRALGIERDEEIIECILGSKVDADATDNVSFLNFLRPSVVHAHAGDGPFTQQRALEQMVDRVHFNSIEYVKCILIDDVLPNVNSVVSEFNYQRMHREKAKYLGTLVKEFMKISMGICAPHDRDGYVYKRVDTSGILMAELFQKAYFKVRDSARKLLDQAYYFGTVKITKKIEELVRPDNIAHLIQHGYITNVFRSSLKGMWGKDVDKDPEQGLVQDLSRVCYIGTLSHLRRVCNDLDPSVKIPGPHRLHSQQWGIMCPFESPDGASVGYIKNFALMTTVTFGTDVEYIKLCLEDLETIKITNVPHHQISRFTRVFLNGQLYGVHSDPRYLTRAFRTIRRNGLINIYTSISWNIADNDVRILCDAGRLCRPLLIAERGDVCLMDARFSERQWFDMVYGTLMKKEDRVEALYFKGYYKSPFDDTFPQFADLVDKQAILKKLDETMGCIDMIDIEETNTSMIALYPPDVKEIHTHCEIHPSTLFSVVTNNIPFANHNQAPRNIFHGAQSKQSVGMHVTNFNKRFDKSAYLHHYPQKPLVTTRGCKYTAADELPNGFNVIVAIATYMGYNQEDGVMINRSAIDRGLFQITAYKSMSAKEETSNDGVFKFANPVALSATTPVNNVRFADYTLLDEDGVIRENSYIPSGKDACIMGMVKERTSYATITKGLQKTFEQRVEYDNVSKYSDVHYYGSVDKVAVMSDKAQDGKTYRTCKVRFRKIRRPELGDKTCSRHGQKGVLGMILEGKDMPFSKHGMVPDIIINPHALPSRMTIGHLVECLFSKACCMVGNQGDGTVFIPFDQSAVASTLESKGFEKHGNEVLYNGTNGMQMETDVFMGPTYYLRLKHMVADKINARGSMLGLSGKETLTRQPTSGRSKNGGLRIGEMERDVLLSYGLAQFASESMMERADKYKWAVCRSCGTLCRYAPQVGIYDCKNCKNDDIALIQTPYAMKLFIQEMETMGIQMRINTEGIEMDDTTLEDDALLDALNENMVLADPVPAPTAAPAAAPAAKKKPMKAAKPAKAAKPEKKKGGALDAIDDADMNDMNDIELDDLDLDDDTDDDDPEDLDDDFEDFEDPDPDDPEDPDPEGKSNVRTIHINPSHERILSSIV